MCCAPRLFRHTRILLPFLAPLLMQACPSSPGPTGRWQDVPSMDNTPQVADAVGDGPRDSDSGIDVEVDSAATVDVPDLETTRPDAPIEDLLPDPELELTRFFSLDAVHTVDLQLDAVAMQGLSANPKEYQRGAITIDGTLFQDVGVRLKGGWGSFVPIDETEAHGRAPGKSAFIIDFNRYVKGQELYGLKKLTLNNMVQDPSGIHQFVGYTYFRQAGIPAPLTGFGTVTLNGNAKGLYALIEAPDNKVFTKRWFGSDNGNLYEGAGSDLTVDAYVNFDQDRGEDTSKEDLRLLATALDSAPAGDAAYETLAANLDVEQYLFHVASELFLGHWDGYAWNTNNYMIYHSLDNDRWIFMPWGIDQLFEENGILGPYQGVMKGPGPSWEKPVRGIDSICNGGRLQHICFDSPTCMAHLAAKFREVAQLANSMDLHEAATQAAELIEPLMLQDAEMYGDPMATKAAIEGVMDFIGSRQQRLEVWLPCLEGQVVDQDGDGANGCNVDCDDTRKAVHPGALEICDLVDDDCNGLLDDAAECPNCVDLPLASGSYSLCFHPTTWLKAQQQCHDRGQELASIHDSDTNMALIWTLFEKTGYIEGWIGLNDITTEQSFEWSDNSPIDFDYRIIEVAAEWGTWLDCYVSNILFGWWPGVCWEEKAYFCKGP